MANWNEVHMYAFTKRGELSAVVHVMSMDLEMAETEDVYTDFLDLVLAMRDAGVDHVAVVGAEPDAEHVSAVDRTLYELSFDVVEKEGQLPEEG